MDEMKQKMLKCLKTLPEKEMCVRVHMSTDFVITGLHVTKNVERSERARLEGNKLYRQDTHNSETHHKIIHHYNESIAFAPSGSQDLASAYGNKSAILRHIRKYAECIIEADKALKITTSGSLKVRLLCRKAECHTALGSTESRNCLEKARHSLSKEEFPDELRKSLQNTIEKTQLIVDAQRLDVPKVFKKRILVAKMIADAQKTDVWASVEIDYSARYGRHLVAARDFEPGEIITAENSFVTRLQDNRIFLYCYHCFEYLWNAVPCEQCAYRLYCSQKCKDEAWDQHHELECILLMKMKEGALFEDHETMPMMISSFFKAYKEAGSIEQLQTDLEALDSCDDELSKGFPADGKFTSYKSLYLLRSRAFNGDEYNNVINSAAIALLGIAKYTDFFGTKYDFRDIKKLRRNDTAIFVGALLFKFAWIQYSRISFARLFDLSDRDYKKQMEEPMCESLKCLGYLFPLTCAPNCKSTVSYGAKHIMYALHPIKKGTPLTSSISSIYDHVKKPKRMETVKQFYNFDCDCRACIEDWFDPEPYGDVVRKELAALPNKTYQIAVSLLREVESICGELSGRSQKENLSDPKLLTSTKMMVAKAWRNFSMPSTVLLRTTSTMKAVYDMFLTSDVLHAPSCGQ